MSALFDKVPPQSVETEQAVLGSMLLDQSAIYVVTEILRPEDFYREAHRYIYQVIVDLCNQGDAVDLVTVVEALQARQELEKAGGATYLASLADLVPTAANVAYYARIVEEKSVLRALIAAAGKIAQRAFEAGGEVDRLLDEVGQLIFEISQRRTREGFSTLKEILATTFDKLERLMQHRGEATGIPTFKDLDKLLSGLQPSDLIICAARPGMGKTSFCLNLAQNAAVSQQIPVAIFSLEMSKEQLAERMLAAAAMVDQHRMRTGFLNEEDWSRLVEAMGTLAEAPVFIDDTPAISVLEVRAKTRRLKAERDLGLIVIDYLQLMQGHRRADSRQQEIAQISRSLKALARELNIPVLVLSQLNRGVEQRQNKRPMMADLFESGAIEADADVVLFLYRDDYYEPDTDKKGIAEVIVGKHRNGPVGTVEMAFLAEYTRFVELAREPLE